MLNLSSPSQKSLRQILCLGAHSNDIEIGCGGTVLKLIETFPDLEVHWVVLGAARVREAEALISAHAFLHNATRKTIVVKDFKNGFFPYCGMELKTFFEQLKQEVSPDLIFTHYHQDLHQDHQFVANLTWNTFRNHFILEYEVPKYDGDLGNPNVFVHLSESLRQRKVAYLVDHFVSQSSKQWFTPDAFTSLLRLRGIQSNAPEKYAEGFYCRKAVLF